MFDFIHTADIHLGYRQYGLRVREEDVKRAVTHIVDKAVEFDVDAVVWAGDVFDAVKPPGDAVRFLKEAIDRLTSANIASLGIDGNHDESSEEWLRVCGITPINNTVTTVYSKKGKESVRFYGYNFRPPAQFMADLEQHPADQLFDVFILHQSLGDIVAFGSEITTKWLAEKLKPLGCKYVAMGDIHDRTEVVVDDVRFVYPGSIEMTKTDEIRDKSFTVVKLDEGVFTTYIEPIPVRTILELDVTTEEDVEALFKAAEGDNVLALIRVNSDLVDADKRIKKKLDGKTPFRLRKFSADKEVKEQFEEPGWDRKTSLVDLPQAVSLAHKEGTDEHQLIIDILNNPDNLESLVVTYLESKGVLHGQDSNASTPVHIQPEGGLGMPAVR